MILNLGCLALELQMKWSIKPFWPRQSKTKPKCGAATGNNSGDVDADAGYYYISYNNITGEESLGDTTGPQDLHYACSSPSSSCNHGDNISDTSYEEVQVEYYEVRKRKQLSDQYWSLQSELLLVESCKILSSRNIRNMPRDFDKLCNLFLSR